MALPYRFFKKTRNRVEKEKANIDINLDEGEEEFKTLPEYYTTIHQVREGGGGGGGGKIPNKQKTYEILSTRFRSCSKMVRFSQHSTKN